MKNLVALFMRGKLLDFLSLLCYNDNTNCIRWVLAANTIPSVVGNESIRSAHAATEKLHNVKKGMIIMAIELFEITHKYSNFPLRLARGHFATGHSHLNYYIDFTMSKHRLSEARAGAQILCGKIPFSQVIDTILCLDGTEVLGACMASELTRAGYMNMNAHRTIYVLSPEYTGSNQIIFRDNTVPMITGKHVLVLAASLATGYTAKSAIEAIRYYGGQPVGVCSIFACVSECEEFPVRSIYNKDDIPDYESHSVRDCPLCKAGVKIDGLVNSHGVSCF